MVIHISDKYLENAFDLGLTTNVYGRVVDKKAMLKYFARKLEGHSDGSLFGRLIDQICAEAIENGEDFVDDCSL